MAKRVIIRGPTQRAYAKRLIDECPQDAVVTFAAPSRSLEQNALMWKILTEVSKAQPEGRQHTPDTWKALFCHALSYEVKFVMGLNGEPFPIGFRTSKMSVPQMTDMIEFMLSWCAEKGVPLLEKDVIYGA